MMMNQVLFFFSNFFVLKAEKQNRTETEEPRRMRR